MTDDTPSPQARITVRSYDLLVDCVETGIAWGLTRADKHAAVPLTPERRAALAEHLEREVIAAITSKFNFPNE